MMISLKDLYNVLANVVPLYITMILAYGSVKWWKIITPQQCSGINNFVSFFAVPFFSFKFISNINPYDMNWSFILADTLQKLIVLFILFLWCKISSRSSLEWSITLFSLSTLPNTHVMGLPLLRGMYGETSVPLVVQIVVMQCIIWYTLLLFLYEYRAARLLIIDRFSETANAIRSFKVDSDVISLDLREQELETEVEFREDGKLNVKLRKSSSIRSWTSLNNINEHRLSNLSNVEIYSLQSTKRESTFNEVDNFYNLVNVTSNLRSSSVKNLEGKGSCIGGYYWDSSFGSKSLNGVQGGHNQCGYLGPSMGASLMPMVQSPPVMMNNNGDNCDEKHVNVKYPNVFERPHESKDCDYHERNGSSLNGPAIEGPTLLALFSSRSSKKVHPKLETLEQPEWKPIVMPPGTVLSKLILVMVWRKLIRNPNTYASVIGLVWSLIECRFHVEMSSIVANSIKIMSDTGLGMAMFSLGLFMALQPQIIAGGYKMAVYAIMVRFIVGPIITAATSIMIGLRGTILHISILQASLPEGILPFVFAKQFDVHPEILSTAVIFGLLIALPITLVYYILLGLIK